MKWFKHLSASKSDPDIMESELKFKSQGPYVFWRMLEIMSNEDAVVNPLIMNFAVFKMMFPSVTHRKLVTILTYFRDKNRIIFKLDNENIILSCDKLSTISSDYSGKVRRLSEQSSKSDRKMSTLEVDLEEDKEKERKKKRVKKKVVKNWKNSWHQYIKITFSAYRELINDQKKMAEQEKFYPGVNIELSIQKAYTNFWGKKEGWYFAKKKRRGKTIDMKSTLVNAIQNNRVWYSKQEQVSTKSESWGEW